MNGRDISRNRRPNVQLPATGQAFSRASRSHVPIRVVIAFESIKWIREVSSIPFGPQSQIDAVYIAFTCK